MMRRHARLSPRCLVMRAGSRPVFCAAGVVLATAMTLTACSKSPQEAQTNSTDAMDTTSASAGASQPDLPFCAEIGQRVSADDCDDARTLASQAAKGVAAFNAPDPMKQGASVTLQLAVAYAPPPAPPPPSPPPPPPPPPAAEGASPDQGGGGSAHHMHRFHHAPLRSADAEVEAPSPPAEIVAQEPPTPAEIVSQEPGHAVSIGGLKVGRHMAAELSGDGFAIKPLSPRVQEVTEDGPTTWEWQVTADRSGQQTLTLKTFIEAQTSAGRWVPLKSTVHDQKITVQVNWWAALKMLLTAAPGWIKLITAVLVALAALAAAGFGLRKALRG